MAASQSFSERFWLSLFLGSLLGITPFLSIACGSQSTIATVATDAEQGGSLGLADATVDRGPMYQNTHRAEGDRSVDSSDSDAAGVDPIGADGHEDVASTSKSGDSAAGDPEAAGGDAGCVHQGPPVLDPGTLPACQCAGAHCLPAGLVPDVSLSLLADCDPSSKCVPDSFIASGGHFLLRTCASLGGAEGRCLSTCIPGVEAQATVLPQSTCAAGELCSPCYDPISGLSTGACNLSCDPGPKQPPVIFPKCCGDAGTCVPSASVPVSQREQLSKDSCPSNIEDYLCAPTEFAEAGGFIPPKCSSIGGGEGRCLSTCLPLVESHAAMLEQASCTNGQVCAPCYDPLTGADTKACRLSKDPGPQEPPFTFPNCCSNRGVCVPATLVPTSEQGPLGRDSCPNDPNEYLCVAPRDFATDASYEPPHCSGKIFGLFGYAGVCLPDCLPPLNGLDGLLISAGSCTMSGYKCAPCTNPLTGQSTGACR
jgi:hypothetical protein